MTSVRPFTEEELQRTSDVDARFLDAMCAPCLRLRLRQLARRLRRSRTAYYA